MFRISVYIILTLIFLFFVNTLSVNGFEFKNQQERLEYQRSIPLTIWPENVPGKPLTYEEWKIIAGEPLPFELITDYFPTADKRVDPTPFGILVNSTLYSYIETSLNQYIVDLNSDGYEVKLHQISGGQPVEFLMRRTAEFDPLKTFLRQGNRSTNRQMRSGEWSARASTMRHCSTRPPLQFSIMPSSSDLRAINRAILRLMSVKCARAMSVTASHDCSG